MKASKLQIYLASALICVSHHAFAEEGAPVPTNPGVSLPAPTPETPAQTPNALARKRDVAIDRGVGPLGAHAETIGDGRWALSFGNPNLLPEIGVTYGLNDDTQVSAALGSIIGESYLHFDAKLVAKRTDRTVVSFQASFEDRIRPETYIGTHIWSTLGCSLLVDHRLDSAGRYSIHGGVKTAITLHVARVNQDGEDEDDKLEFDSGAPIELALGTTLLVTDWFSVLLQGDLKVGLGSLEARVGAGLRFHSGDFAFEVGSSASFTEGDSEMEQPGVEWPVVPYLGFSAAL